MLQNKQNSYLLFVPSVIVLAAGIIQYELVVLDIELGQFRLNLLVDKAKFQQHFREFGCLIAR